MDSDEEAPNPWANAAFDADGRLVDLSGPVVPVAHGEPPPMRWAHVADLDRVFGRRLCAMAAEGAVMDLRAASEVFESNGGFYVNVVDEIEWYRWLDKPADLRPGRIPRATCLAARHVWAEVISQMDRPASDDAAGDIPPVE